MQREAFRGDLECSFTDGLKAVFCLRTMDMSERSRAICVFKGFFIDNRRVLKVSRNLIEGFSNSRIRVSFEVGVDIDVPGGPSGLCSRWHFRSWGKL